MSVVKTSTSGEEALVARLHADLDDAEAWLVYGDLLEQRGDPRGELIALEAAALRAEQGGAEERGFRAELAARLEVHRGALLGELAERPREDLWLSWRWGHVFEAEVAKRSDGRILSRLPCARFIRRIEEMTFPAALRPYRESIESTAIPTLLFARTPGATRPHQSKMGGVPYFPYDHPMDWVALAHPRQCRQTPWPKHPLTGQELALLIQINFEELPPLPSFPREGILQLFVDDEDWHHLDRHLRAIYHREVVTDPGLLFADFGLEERDERVSESSLSFYEDREYITESDYRFEAVYSRAVAGERPFFPAHSAPGQAGRSYLEITDHRYHEHPMVGYARNKLGGYHYSQNSRDGRSGMPGWDDSDSVLLFQFQDYEELSWGDGGSAQFYIKRAALEACDFSDLLFHWDST